VYAAVLALALSCPGDRAARGGFDFAPPSSGYSEGARFSSRDRGVPFSGYYQPRQGGGRVELFFEQDRRRGILPWRYSDRRTYRYRSDR
jgi:hypothetical protein